MSTTRITKKRNFLIIAIFLLAVGTVAIFTAILWLSFDKPAVSVTPEVTTSVVETFTPRPPTETVLPTSTATLEPVANETPTPIAPITYVVVAGDSLSGIAVKFQVSMDAIILANNLTGDVIYVGQVLTIPLGEVAPGATAALTAGEYRVKPGDTLESIAAANGTSVQQLRDANYMYGDSILPGQKIRLPDVNPAAPVWTWSVLEGDRIGGYPLTYDAGDFTLRYQPNSFPSIDPGSVAGLAANAITNAESIFGVDLGGRFSVYAAGTLFEPNNQHLRGRSFSALRETLFLYDGSGDPADQQYIVAHELTHLYMWNVFGVPSSVMISEGAAVYSGMNAIAGSDHLALKSICKLLYDAGRLPNIASELGYSGHNYDLDNYYTAGCFVGYLVDNYSPASVGLVYPNSNYINVFGKSLTDLERDFEISLALQPAVTDIDPVQFSKQVDAVSDAYRSFFSAFSPTPEKLEQYRMLDHARLELLKGNLPGSQQLLSQLN